VAVPEKVMQELKTKENLAKLLSRDNEGKLPAGVVVYPTRGTTRDLKGSDPRTKVENVVTISSDEKAGVKFTAKETPPPSLKEDGSDASTQLPVGTIMAGLASALAIASAGIWYFRGRQPQV